MESPQTNVEWLAKYLRLTNYLSVAQLYLRDNFLLEDDLKPEHIKRRIVGHWGTVPGINFIWATLNLAIKKFKQETLLVVGPGHGYPAVQSNLFVEGSLGEFFADYKLDADDKDKRKEAFGKLIKNFSWPGGFPSHSNPYTPGCILEGGELGYSLSTSYGAALDNPDLIVACIVGDGEAETGPMATSWHSNKFLNPITSGTVLPILHLNGYKISGPTILGTMSDEELTKLFEGYGYEPKIVEGNYLFEPMITALDESYAKIKSIQKIARENGKIDKPKWPMIILRSPKGWFGPANVEENKQIVGTFRAHGIPLEHPVKDSREFEVLKSWLMSYRIHELVNENYEITKDILEFVPEKDLTIGRNKKARAIGTKNLILPDLKDYEVVTGCPGENSESSMERIAIYIRDIFKLNNQENNFRIFCPDETESNKLGGVFETTKRAYIWPLKDTDENIDKDGRVMEMLSEHTLEGWMQGYVLTGRHGIFVTYEAFAEIISSMVDQYIKFMHHARKISWRMPVPSLNIILTSLNWRQDHNGFSHQNPGFISSVLNSHANFVDIYFPSDCNSTLVTLEECLKSKCKINVIVADKRPACQWLTLNESYKQLQEDIRIWDFASDSDPDVVLAGCGDHPMREIIATRIILKKLIPDLKVRIVNIIQLSCFGIGDNQVKCRINSLKFNDIFTSDKPIIFNYHGYPEDIKSLIFNHHSASRFSVHGYCENGTTTTPFDMLVRNKVDRYNLAIEAIKFASAKNEKIAKVADEIVKKLETKLEEHTKFINENGFDMEDVEEFDFKIG